MTGSPSCDGRKVAERLTACKAGGIPAGPVTPDLRDGRKVGLIGNPLRLSGTPATYRKGSPDHGADSGAALAAAGVIGKGRDA
jgi:hypothetical protein